MYNLKWHLQDLLLFENVVFFSILHFWTIKSLLKVDFPRLPGDPVVKNPPADMGDTGSIPGLGRSCVLPKPVSQTAESEPACCTYWHLRSLEPVLRKEKRPRNEPQALQAESNPRLPQGEKACGQQPRPSAAIKGREGKGREGKVGLSSSTLQFRRLFCNSVDCTVHGILYARILEWGTEPRSPLLQADSLPVEPQGKPKNSGVSSLYLLQRNFPTQESNRGLLHCRWIL